MKTLETKRLIIRKIKKSDYKDMALYSSKETIGPNAGWTPHKNIKETKNIVKLMYNSNEVFAICIKPFDNLVGTISLHKIDNKYELGFVLDDIYWGLGYMSEAVERILFYVFTELEIDTLYISHYDFNKRSEAIIKKNNFIYLKEEYKEDIYKKMQLIKYYYLTKEKYNERIRKKI